MTRVRQALPEVLQFAVPCTFIDGPDGLLLVAGEDIRLVIHGREISQWALPLLDAVDGTRAVDTLLSGLPPNIQSEAESLLARLKAERLLVTCDSSPAVRPLLFDLEVLGKGDLAEKICASRSFFSDPQSSRRLQVLCQNDLNYEEARSFGRKCLEVSTPYAWVSYGAQSRAFVSPIYLPDSGPCLECLIDGFESLSPSPEIYDALTRHAQTGGKFSAARFPPEGIEIIAHLLTWKLRLLYEGANSPAPSRLHVLETSTLEVESHRVFRNPGCPGCACWRN